ncbi:MAG: response regulator [Desulfobacula sp.]|nr:response regulator [Desulfobacula sp.]
MDDEEDFRKAITRRLARRGMNPVQASHGQECLDILGKKPMDVVVLDVKMPGISGIDTLKAIKKKYEKIQVILLTGNVAVSDGIEGIKSGAFDYLTKPVEIDHLANKINQAFEIIQREKEKQKELEYRAKLEKKMIDTERLVSLGTMSTGIAHEINNPLAIINESVGFMKYILNTPEMLKTQKIDSLMMGIEKIEKSIKRARKITHQLLGHVKKQGSHFSQVNVKELLEETLGLLKKELEYKQIKIYWEIDEKKNLIWSDPYQVRQILVNLLNNGIHAIKENGSITLSTYGIGDDIVLTITDTGVGIPRENLGKIFDPFFTTKSFDEGTGLGLFVVHKIISGLAGTIDVTSTVGKGTCFQVRLPQYHKS